MTNPTTTRRGSAVAHDLDGFLGHKRGGGGATFLKKWKKREPPVLRVVVHTKASVALSIYQMPWPKVVTLERDGNEVTEVWNSPFNTWEIENIIERQYKRDQDTGERLAPPEICPMAIMLEEVERLMREEVLSWHTLLFAFKGDDKEFDKYLFAGAITNKAKKIWDDQTITAQEKKAARKKGFPGKHDAWKTNMMAKCQYVLTVLDYDDPDAGIQIAQETALVGDLLKKTIRDRRTAEGEDEGNPLINPYVFKISHHPKEEQFQDRYQVVAIGKKLPITDAMLEVVRERDAPNLDRYTAPGDIVALRSSMEDHYVGPPGLLDFDMIFSKAEAELEIDNETPEETPEETPDKEEDADRHQPDRIIAKRKGKGADQQCFAADGMALFGCEKCEAIMREDEDICHNCGENYVENEAPMTPEPEPKPAPPPRRARNAGASKKNTPAKKGGNATTRAAKAGQDGVGF